MQLPVRAGALYNAPRAGALSGGGVTPVISRAVDIGDLTSSRTGTASYVDADGVIQSAADGVLRSAHHVYDSLGVLHECTLLEGQKTNLALQSEDISSASYASVGTPDITANTDTAPDGTLTGDTLADTDVAGIEGRRQTFTVSNDSNPYCYSHFVKKTVGALSAYPVFNLRLTGGTALDGYIVVDTTNGTVGQSANGHVSRYGIEDDGDYWRVWLVVTNNGTGNTSMLCSFYPAGNTSFSAALVAGGTGSQVFWGMQVEQAAFPSSYIKTTTAAITRNADLAYYTGAGAGSPLVTPMESWFYTKFVEGGSALSTTFARVWELSSSSNALPRLLLYQTGATYRLEHGVVSAVSSDVTPPTLSQLSELLGVLYSDGSVQLFARYANGSVVAGSKSAANALAENWAGSRIYINSINTSNAGRNNFIANGNGELITVGTGLPGGASATAEEAMAYAAARHAYEAAA